MDEFSQYTKQPFTVINLATPEVLMSGLLGTMMIFMITGELLVISLHLAGLVSGLVAGGWLEWDGVVWR